MRARFRAPGLTWRTGTLSIDEVKDKYRHRRMKIVITSPDGKSIAFEIQDADIFRLADGIVDSAEEYDLTVQQGGAA